MGERVFPDDGIVEGKAEGDDDAAFTADMLLLLVDEEVEGGEWRASIQRCCCCCGGTDECNEVLEDVPDADACETSVVELAKPSNW